MAICLFSLPKEVRESVRLWHFEPCVEKKSKDECWEWLGSRVKRGYGQVFRFIEVEGQEKKKKIAFAAHRLAWMFKYNCPIPAGLNCCHTCDNPGCANADHIFLGTQKMNIQDARRKGRMFRGKYRQNGKKPIK